MNHDIKASIPDAIDLRNKGNCQNARARHAFNDKFDRFFLFIYDLKPCQIAYFNIFQLHVNLSVWVMRPEDDRLRRASIKFNNHII